MNAFEMILITSVLGTGLCSAMAGGANSSVPGNKEVASSQISAQHQEAASRFTTAEMRKFFISQSGIIVYAMTGTYDDQGIKIPRSISLSPASSIDKVSAAIPDKSASIVTYSSNAEDNSCDLVASHLESLGYHNVKVYHEGIQGWINAGNPAEE